MMTDFYNKVEAKIRSLDKDLDDIDMQQVEEEVKFEMMSKVEKQIHNY